MVDWLPGFVTLIVFGPVTTVQLNAADPETPVVVSFAVTVTAVAGAAAWVVPEMTPLEALMLSPGGSPVADQCTEGLGLVSVACIVRETGVLDLVVWLPGLVTVTALIVQVNDALPLPPLVSAAVTVTEEVPPVVAVPVMTAVVAPWTRCPARRGAPTPTSSGSARRSPLR